MMRIAASMSLAFRSFIFASAISRTCACVTLPAVSRPTSLEPDLMPAACFRYQVAGGVLVMKVKDLS
ncbi:hypothetical protein D3C86_1904210 [compost metagenome]